MEVRELLELLTLDNIKSIMSDLYGCSYKSDKQGNTVFESVCHGSINHKLYCYHDTNDDDITTYTLHCYVCGFHGDIISLVEETLGYDFSLAFKTIGDYLGVNVYQRKKLKGIKRRQHENEDLAFLNIHNKRKRKDRVIETEYDDTILECFAESYPLCWRYEGIDGYTADKFDLRYDHNNERAVIPVRNIEGKLIGIRVRNFEESAVERGFKYLPLDFRGVSYRFATSSALYGIYENQDVIRRKRKVLLCEGEKSVNIVDSYYEGECYALAVYGSNFSHVQLKMLIDLEITEVVLAFDKEYCDEYYGEDYSNTKEQRLMFNYFEKLKKVCKMLINYFTVHIIIDFDNLLELKDAPVDKGKEVFETLYRSRVTIMDVDKDFEDMFGV